MSDSDNIKPLPVTPARPATTSLAPRNITEAIEFSTYLARSTMVPKEYIGKPENVLVALQMGAELGLQPMAALQNVAVINGKPAVYGDAAIAIVRGHPACDDVIETYDADTMTATCTVLRRGSKPIERTFSKDDATVAGLWGKQGPWSTYPKRMLQMRARGFALRDAFPDALRGIAIAEEIADYEKPVDGDAVSASRETPAEPPATQRSADEQLVGKLAGKVNEPDDRFAHELRFEVSDLIARIQTADDATAIHAELREGGRYYDIDADTKRELRKQITAAVAGLNNDE